MTAGESRKAPNTAQRRLARLTGAAAGAETNEAALLTRAAQSTRYWLKRRMTAHQHRRGSNDSEKKHVTYGLVSDYSARHTTVGGNMWTKVHLVAWKSLVRIFSLAPKLSGFRRCILSQILNFHD